MSVIESDVGSPGNFGGKLAEEDGENSSQATTIADGRKKVVISDTDVETFNNIVEDNNAVFDDFASTTLLKVIPQISIKDHYISAVASSKAKFINEIRYVCDFKNC